MTLNEAKDYVAMQTIAPDDLIINGKPWKLECTYMTRKEALGSAEYLNKYKLFKYANGYALYERNYE
jgi:hypothetical protein